jgi:broad specificity phosphatase PhoE
VSAARVWFVRHGEIASHRGDVPLTAAGAAQAEAAGAALLDGEAPPERLELLHAPTARTAQTAEALRRGLGAGAPPRVEPAIRNPDLYVAGRRVEMVSSVEALAEQLPPPARDEAELARHPFFSRFWAERDRVGVWMRDADPPGETADEVARRCFTFARSLADAGAGGAYVCVTHSGPLRALLRRYVLGEDPGEPGWVEPVALTLSGDGARWRFRGLTVP